MRNASVKLQQTVRSLLTKTHTNSMNNSTNVNLIPNWTSWVHLFPCKRFHVLLNSLFKVLCNFPSRYLFAIGLTVVFSLRWSIPPTLGCTLKQPDSMMNCLCKGLTTPRDLHPLWLELSLFKSIHEVFTLHDDSSLTWHRLYTVV